MLGFAGITQAATVGQWNQSSSIWASAGNFGSIYSAASNGLNATIETPEAITAANLANDNFFVVHNPKASLTASEATALFSWVSNGGILLLFADAAAQVGNANSLLTGVHSNLSFTSDRMGSDFYQVGANMTGNDITSGLTGGLGFYSGLILRSSGPNVSLATGQGNFDLNLSLRMQAISLGKVYVFGTALDADYNRSGWSNQAFFLSLLSQQVNAGNFGGGGISGGGSLDLVSNPEPSTVGLFGFAVAGLLFLKRRKN
jgi:hypothetical protein